MNLVEKFQTLSKEDATALVAEELSKRAVVALNEVRKEGVSVPTKVEEDKAE
jgi:hypothetical protein